MIKSLTCSALLRAAWTTMEPPMLVSAGHVPAHSWMANSRRHIAASTVPPSVFRFSCAW